MSVQAPTRPIAMLLIEANHAAASALHDALTRDSRSHVALDCAERLEAGIALLAQRPYAMVLLALDLPDSRGLATFTQLHHRYPHMPVVVCTDSADEQVALTAVQAGAQDYIVKGVANWALAPHVIRYALERHQAHLALHASELRFRAMIESSGDVINLLDANGSIRYTSPSVMAVLGYQPEELLGRSGFELLHPDDAATMGSLFVQVLQQPEAKIAAQCRYQHKDGTWRWLNAIVTNLLADRNVQALVVNYRDVTARKQAEAQRDQSERMFRLLAETMEDLIWQADAQFVFTYASPSVEKLYGYSPAAFVGKSLLELMPVYAHARANVKMSEQMDRLRHGIGDKQGSVQLEQLRRDGSTFWAEILVSAHYDQAGALVSFQGVTRDISARKQAALQLEERVRERTAELEIIRQRLEVATRAAGMGIWEWDPATDRLIWDEQMLKLYGLTSVEFNGTSATFRRAIHPADLPLQIKLFMGAMRGELAYDSEFRVIWPDGTERDLKANAVTLRGTNGRVERIIGVNYDITLRKQAENLLHRNKEHLRRVNSELERAMRMKDEFLASMSHELRTPLNSILGFAEALQELIYGSLNERQMRALENIASSGRHLLALINDILDLSKTEAGKLELQLEPCSLDEICQTSLALVKGLAHKRHQSLAFSIIPTQISLQADMRRLKQVLINLLSNAIKFTPEGGAIGLDVQLKPESQTIYLSVWDHGIGISAADLPKLFQPFVQLDSSLTRQHTGTGLGLSLVQRLVALHGGFIEVTSTLGEGSRFTVVLPWRPVPMLRESYVP